MSTHRILSRGVATLLALTPFALHAATQTITAAGDPTDGSPGALTAWGVGANWGGPNGATLPGVNDVAVILSDSASQTGVDIRATDFTGAPPNFTEVQGISFTGTSFSEVDLENNSDTTNMTLALNGGGGTVPLIQTGDYAVQILGVGLGVILPTTATLTLQLKGNGDFSVGSGGLTISSVISSSGGAFGFNKTGTGTLMLSGTAANTYTGTTTISEGQLIANKPAGTNAIGGNLVINAGGTFMYQGNNIGNQIANTSVVTLNGGDFGDMQTAPTNPGAAETVGSLVVNSGNFSTGRAVFAATGLVSVNGGTTLIHRGGSLTAGSFSLGAGAIVSLDGGATTAGAESKLTVGAGGVTLNGGTINFNTGGSGIVATSTGSILTLGGNLTATGTNDFVHLNPFTTGANPKAVVAGVRRHFAADAQGRLFGRAALLGLGAALVGSAVFAVAMVQRISFWILICAGIGWLVGKAVRKGSGGLGGVNYQILAVILTYLSICGAFGAELVHDTGSPDDAGEVMNLVLAALTKPVTGGMNGIYGLAAMAFGVWESWQLNRGVKLEITGPHGIGGSATGG